VGDIRLRHSFLLSGYSNTDGEEIDLKHVGVPHELASGHIENVFATMVLDAI